MKKVFVVNITSSNLNDNGYQDGKLSEFDLTELNKLLVEGWKIEKYDIVTNQTSVNFSIVYQLEK